MNTTPNSPLSDAHFIFLTRAQTLRQRSSVIMAALSLSAAMIAIAHQWRSPEVVIVCAVTLIMICAAAISAISGSVAAHEGQLKNIKENLMTIHDPVLTQQFQEALLQQRVISKSHFRTVHELARKHKEQREKDAAITQLFLLHNPTAGLDPTRQGQPS